MKHFIIACLALLTIMCCSSCSHKVCQYELSHKPNGICGEEVYDGNYCFTHKCIFCENPITSGSSYCDEHRCQFDIGYGRCSHGIGTVALKRGDIYCDTHKSIEDINEFKKAKEIASTWCNTVAAESAGTLFSPFKFTDNFQIDGSTYKFGVKEIDYPYRNGYVIVKRDSNGKLKCEGMRYT